MSQVRKRSEKKFREKSENSILSEKKIDILKKDEGKTYPGCQRFLVSVKSHEKVFCRAFAARAREKNTLIPRVGEIETVTPDLIPLIVGRSIFQVSVISAMFCFWKWRLEAVTISDILYLFGQRSFIFIRKRSLSFENG